MKMLPAILITTLLGATTLFGKTLIPTIPEVPEEALTDPQSIKSQKAFTTLDIAIDPKGQPLGAFQFELTSTDASFTVVGVEAGEHLAFDHGRPPYFDPVAQQGKTDRLILAEYALPELEADKLPTQAIRVATVHVMLSAPLNENEQPGLNVTLTVAGDADGNRIDADVSHTFRTPGVAPERPQ